MSLLHNSEVILDILDPAIEPECVLVAENHPIIAVLENMTSTGEPIRYDRWIRLERNLVHALCAPAPKVSE
jgi:hypothetical protein